MVESTQDRPPTCGNCRFWQNTAPNQIVGQPAGGECHRFPPTGQLVPAGPGQIGAAAVWPPTQGNQSCGEHKPIGGSDG